MQECSIRRASKNDVPLIRRLAEIIWREHYPAIIGTEQVEYMLQRMYSEFELERQIGEGQVFYICHINNEALGFFSVQVKEDGSGFIPKFYLAREQRGRGVAAAMMNEALRYLSAHGCKEVRLQVNRMNIRPLNFYFKQGFKIEKAADLDIGDGFFMNDFIMLKKLGD
ncbi:MAG: GNAT family N-acetyltransferase [Bacteroidia bacterium]|nr:GNAT family N-acetyltransferase [Bacteroidia bacterium]